MTRRLLPPAKPTSSPCILYVDDEVKAQQYFKEAFDDEFTIFTATQATEAYHFLLQEKDRIGILVCDQRMPGESGVELLEKARRLNPNLIRILVTAYTDYDTAIQAVNDSRIFRFVHKPWDAEEMQSILHLAAEHYLILVERERLLAEKAEALRHMQMADKVASFGILAEGLNHHIRNALTVIRAFVDLAPLKLSEELNGGTPQADPSFWDDLHSQAQQQISRIQTVLYRLGEASQRLDVALVDRVDLTALLDETSLIYAHAFSARNVHCSHYVHPSVPMILGNTERLRQLWHLLYADLLANLSPGDRVRISVELAAEASGKPVVQMFIDDTGAWSSHENVANLFDPFFVRSHQPHELGVNLTACYVIVHQHGGTIEAIPRGSGGTGGLRIQITLPIDPAERPSDDVSFFLRLLEHEQRWKQREA